MHFCHRQTDRRTDSQTQGYGIYRASIYTVVSRGKKKNNIDFITDDAPTLPSAVRSLFSPLSL